ncbi:zinc finger, CCHC-type containing protein [Tanacetum coccineum]
MFERQFTTKLKNVDWGGEFRNLALFFSSPGIIHQRSCLIQVKETEDKATTALSPYKMSGSLDYVRNMHSQQAAEPAPQTFVSLLEFLSEIYEGVNVGPSSGAPHAISSLNRQAGGETSKAGIWSTAHPSWSRNPGTTNLGNLSKQKMPTTSDQSIKREVSRSTFLHTTGSSRLTTNKPDPSRVRATDAQRSSAPVLLEVQAQPKEAHLSMFKISGNNFNDWFRQLKMVLRVERKLFVIEHPISPAPPTDSEYLRSGIRYMIHNEELKSMFEKQARVEWFDLIQTFHACKQDEGKPVGTYPHYNKHNMGKTVGELHAMLIEYEKGLPKKAETPQVMMIKGGKIQKSNKKSLKAKGKGKANGKGKDKQVYIPKPKNPKPSAKEHPAKDDTCHHCKEVGHCKRNCPAYLAELIKKKKQVGTASSSDE